MHVHVYGITLKTCQQRPPVPHVPPVASSPSRSIFMHGCTTMPKSSAEDRRRERQPSPARRGLKPRGPARFPGPWGCTTSAWPMTTGAAYARAHGAIATRTFACSGPSRPPPSTEAVRRCVCCTMHKDTCGLCCAQAVLPERSMGGFWRSCGSMGHARGIPDQTKMPNTLCARVA
jgi:hypothetical protein